MTWPKATPGQPLRIPASLHNATIEAVEAFLRKRFQAGGSAAASRPGQAEVLISNDTGGNLAAGSVVGLDSPIADDPTADLNAFLLGELIFSGIEPDEDYHLGCFAVLTEPVPDGHVGRSIVQGVVRVQVVFDSGDEEWADITDGETATLTAAESGSARILWRAGSGSGTAWTLCLLGCGVPASAEPGQAIPRDFAFRAHVSSVEVEETPAFFTIPDCLNSWLTVWLECRECDGEGEAGAHPAYEGSSVQILTTVNSNTINSGADGHDNWFALTARLVTKSQTNPTGSTGTISGSSNQYIQARVSTAGNFELRIKNTVGVTSWPWVVYGRVSVVGYDPTMDMVEVGTDELIDAGPAGIHEGGAGAADESEWGDDVWTPG